MQRSCEAVAAIFSDMNMATSEFDSHLDEAVIAG